MGEAESGTDVGQQLSLAARPKTLDGLVGQESVAAAIRGHFKQKRYPKAWLFHGPKGTGKTTTSRILALCYQCRHQERLGVPCKECWQMYRQYPIIEISAAMISTKEEMRVALSGANAGVMGFGRYRIYIINEIQRSSPACLSLFLDMLEDTPKTTVFIFTTTESSKLSEPFRSRCQCYEFRDLDTAGIEKLVARLLKRIKSDLPGDRLIEALMDARVFSPRLVAQAVDKYAAGCTPEEAAEVSGAPEVDIMALSRAVTHGDWPNAARFLQSVEGGDARALRALLVNYLRRQLLESPEISTRADAIAKAIALMAEVSNAEDSVVFAAICASAYSLTKIFSHFTV